MKRLRWVSGLSAAALAAGIGFAALPLVSELSFAQRAPAPAPTANQPPIMPQAFSAPFRPYGEAMAKLQAEAASRPVTTIRRAPRIGAPVALPQGKAAQTLGGGGMGTMSLMSAPSPLTSQCPNAPDEVIELARGLKYDADLIYEYVHNNIETVPQFGSLKGPLGTILDQAGTAHDQAELMVCLLAYSGITASYQTGTVNFTGAQLNAWLGTGTGTDSKNAVQYLLGGGGFSGTITAGAGNSIASVDIAWMWVKANLGGTNYLFNPAKKSYARAAGIGASALQSALGYSQSTFLSNAMSGATLTSTLPITINGVHNANLKSGLQTMAMALANYIRTNHPAASLNDIIGGKTITPLTPNTQQRLTTLSEVSGAVTDHSSFPTALRTVMQLALAYGSTAVFYTSDIYGRRLTIRFNSSNVPDLYLEGVAQNVPGAAGAYNMELNIVHPYSNSGWLNLRFAPGANQTYLINNAWGRSGRGVVERHRKQLAKNKQANPDPVSEAVLGQSLALLGAAWHAQVSRAGELLDELTLTAGIYHHGVGIVGFKTLSNGEVAPNVDLPINVVSTVQRDSRATSTGPLTPRESAGFYSFGMFASIQESGIIEQTQPGSTAVSTVKLLDIWGNANSANLIYDINNSAIAGNDATYWTNTIKPILQANGYSTGDIDQMNDLVVNKNQRVIAPRNGNISDGGTYSGVGYYAIGQTGTSIGALISGGLKGGFGSRGQPSPAVSVDFTEGTIRVPSASTTSTTVGAGGAPSSVSFPASREPINLVTGDYFYDHTDLVVGSAGFPYGLGFARNYDSGRRFTKGALGLGWTHNFVITAAIDSDAFEGMGANSPVSATMAIAGLFVAYDLLNTSTGAKPLDRMIVANQVFKWAMDRMTGNVVSIVQPGNTAQYVKLADGTFNPPLGNASTLVANDSNPGAAPNPEGFTLTTKTQEVLTFTSHSNAANNTQFKLATWAMPSGVTVTLSYDSSSPPRLTSVGNGLSRTLTLGYNGSGFVSSVSDGTRSVGFGYDTTGNLTSATDTTSQVTTFEYDAPGRLTKIFYPAFPTTPFVVNTYDSLDRVATQRDANYGTGNDTTWGYYFAGSRSEEEDPYGNRHILYNSRRGKTLRETDFAGNTTAHAYDGQDRRTVTTLPEGDTLTYTYDGKHNVLSVAHAPKPPNAGGLPTLTQSFTYHTTYNKVATATDPMGRVATYTYGTSAGAAGNVTQVVQDTGGLNVTTSFTYNSRGQAETVTDPVGTVTKNVYHGSNETLTSVTRGFGLPTGEQSTTSFGYDTIGNVTSVTDPRSNVTSTTYDAMRRALQVTLPLPNQVVKYTYDDDGRVTKTERGNPSSGPWEVRQATYSPSGKVLVATNPDGSTVTTAYDLKDRAAQVTQQVSSNSADDRVTQLTYDGEGRVATVIDATSNTAEQHSYTANGQKAWFKDARGYQTSYTYDDLDRLYRATHPDTSFEQFAYDNAGNVTAKTWRDGQAIANTYDALNRLTQMSHAASGRTVTYTYDAASRVTAANDNSAAITSVALPQGVAGVAYTTTYTYDALNRPTGISWDNVNTQTSGASAAVTFDHWYNKAHQRTYQTANDNSWWSYPAASPSTVSYSTNNVNQYTAVGATSPTYTGKGSLATDGTFTYTYDGWNRLATAAGSGNSATYTYDAQGRRKTKTVNGTTTVYVNSGDQEVLEYDGSTGQILAWYAYGAGIDEALNRIQPSGDRVTLIPDIQGSVIGSLDSATAGLAKTAYLPFGESANTSGSYRYTGRRIDAETNGLYYYRARTYSPTLGRFIQPDPIGYLGGANLYAYVLNDPLNATDPSGEVANFIWGAVIGAGVDAAVQLATTGTYDWKQGLAATVAGSITGGASALIGRTALQIGGRAVANGVVGGVVNTTQTSVLNTVNGKSDSLQSAAIVGFAFGFAGSAGGDKLANFAAARYSQSVSLEDKLSAAYLSSVNANLSAIPPRTVAAANAAGMAFGGSTGLGPNIPPIISSAYGADSWSGSSGK